MIARQTTCLGRRWMHSHGSSGAHLSLQRYRKVTLSLHTETLKSQSKTLRRLGPITLRRQIVSRYSQSVIRSRMPSWVDRKIRSSLQMKMLWLRRSHGRCKSLSYSFATMSKLRSVCKEPSSSIFWERYSELWRTPQTRSGRYLSSAGLLGSTRQSWVDMKQGRSSKRTSRGT